MYPFTVFLIVAAAALVIYGVVTFVRPKRGHHISQDAADSNSAINDARSTSSRTTDMGGGGGSL